MAPRRTRSDHGSRPLRRVHRPADVALRGARGVAVASASALITGLGHVAGGGTVPDLGLLVALFPLLAALIVALADACRSIPGVLTVLGAGQFAMHEIMDVLGHTHAAVTGNRPSMLGMHVAATIVTGLLIRDADQVLATVLSALGRVLPRRLALPPADRPLPTFAVPSPAVIGDATRALLRPLARRGPPIRV